MNAPLVLPPAIRICIIGNSSTGKSTLCNRLGTALNLPVIHLDRLYHQPTGNWVPRPYTEFVALHDTAIQGDNWVMDGNYKKTLPQRFDRATHIIHLKMNRFGRLYRFIKRYFHIRAGMPRVGQPEQIADTFRWVMVWWIIQPVFINKARRQGFRDLQALLNQHPDKVVTLRSFRQIDTYVAQLVNKTDYQK